MLTEGKDDILGLIDGVILEYTLGTDDTEGVIYIYSKVAENR